MPLSLRDLLDQNEFWIFLFAVVAIMLNWPMISMAEGGMDHMGLPPVLIYISAVWLLAVLMMFLFDRRRGD